MRSQPHCAKSRRSPLDPRSEQTGGACDERDTERIGLSGQ
jgi:hypothetical protein